MTATSTTSPGQLSSPTRWPMVGLLDGRVISTRLVAPSWKVSSRTRSPTVTASSTKADISRGVDTATSTPHTSLNIHSFFGWLTRPTVRGTPNSVLASSDITRLALSSPVAAMATSQLSSPASSREESSQASASSHSAWSRLSARMARGSLSISSTSCPFSTSSAAMERPTLPAPAMATRMVTLLGVERGWSGCCGDPPVRLGAGRQQPAEDLVGGPADGGDGGDAQPLVDLGPAGVVDPGHDVVD